jgi:LacI family transcriptional regulator
MGVRERRRAAGRPVTLKDVARRAEVAWSTASYALNNGPKPVSAEVRERVLKAAQELGYQSNLLARGLVTGRAHAVGVMVRELRSHNSAPMIAGAEAAARERSYQVLLATHEHEPDHALATLRGLSARRVDGIVSLASTADLHPAVVSSLTGTGLPFALGFHAPQVAGGEGSAGSENEAHDRIEADHEGGGHLATSHLIERGRKRIAYLGGSPHKNATRWRQSGYERALREAGLEPDALLIGYGEFYSAPSGYAAARSWLQRPREQWPDAIFAAADLLAMGVLNACREFDARVPEDIALIGFDNRDWCNGLVPPLSSVEMPLEELGYECMHRLIDRLERPDSWRPQHRVLPCTLVVRDSS